MKKQILAGAMFALAASVCATPPLSAYADTTDNSITSRLGEFDRQTAKKYDADTSGKITGAEGKVLEKDTKNFGKLTFENAAGSEHNWGYTPGNVVVKNDAGKVLFDGGSGTGDLANALRAVQKLPDTDPNKQAFNAFLEKNNLKQNGLGYLTHADGTAVDGSEMNAAIQKGLGDNGAEAKVQMNGNTGNPITVEDTAAEMFAKDRKGIAAINNSLEGQDGLKQRVQDTEKLSAGNAEKIDNLGTGLSGVRETAEQAKGTAEDNTKNITANKQGIAANKQAVMDTQSAIGDDEFRKTSVQDRMSAMNQRFATDLGNAQAQGKAYVDNTAAQTLNQANSYTDSRYNQLNSKMKKLRARADSGIAGATAIGSLTFDTLKPNSISGGLGVAKNKVAGAVGYQRNFNENWRARATVSVSDNYVQGGTSVGYSW